MDRIAFGDTIECGWEHRCKDDRDVRNIHKGIPVLPSLRFSGEFPAGTRPNTFVHALPCLRYEKQQNKPKPSNYPEQPVTIGDRIRKKRMDLKLYQCDVARVLKVSEATVCNWETNRSEPVVSNYPFIIEFLGYFPFEVDTSTFAGKLKEYRYKNGLTQELMGEMLKVDESTVFHWEKGVHTPFPKMLKKVELLFAGKPVNLDPIAPKINNQ